MWATDKKVGFGDGVVETAGVAIGIERQVLRREHGSGRDEYWFSTGHDAPA